MERKGKGLVINGLVPGTELQTQAKSPDVNKESIPPLRTPEYLESCRQAEEKVLAQEAVENQPEWAWAIIHKETFRLPAHFRSPVSPKAKDQAAKQLLGMLKNGRSPAETRGYAQQFLREAIVNTEADERRKEHDKGKTWSSNP